MRRFLTISAASAVLATAAALAPAGARAMPLVADSLAAAGAPILQNVDYVCRPVWRCGYWGCGWRRACWWRPGPVWGYGYGYYRPYRPGVAWGWGHRPWGWRHHW